ncbi:hypothetical protein MAL1_00192 [Bacteriophage DSS3_MAL1]|nr:hypothetical protein MAL1_00192 [Bacteriophage DSS3_MAL1]
MAEAGWVNLPRDGEYEVQENVFSGAFRHRQYRGEAQFHQWEDGKPPYHYLKEHNRDEG